MRSTTKYQEITRELNIKDEQAEELVGALTLIAETVLNKKFLLERGYERQKHGNHQGGHILPRIK